MAKKDIMRARDVAEVLQEALVFLRSSARTEDFFTGYSLSEVISERLAIIGNADGSTAELTPRGLPTKQAELTQLLESVTSAVEQAKKLPLINKAEVKAVVEEDDE